MYMFLHDYKSLKLYFDMRNLIFKIAWDGICRKWSIESFGLVIFLELFSIFIRPPIFFSFYPSFPSLSSFLYSLISIHLPFVFASSVTNSAEQSADYLFILFLPRSHCAFACAVCSRFLVCKADFSRWIAICTAIFSDFRMKVVAGS